jgi:DsbC/DsbD-like thiol-disulfide interchange protein
MEVVNELTRPSHGRVADELTFASQRATRGERGLLIERGLLNRMGPRRARVTLLFAAWFCGVSLAQAPGTNASPNQTVQWAATLAATGGVKQGGETTLELSGTIDDGWHVYALTEPAGGPTALRVTLDENEVAEVAGAASGTAPSKRHDRSFGLVTQFYTHSFTVRLPVQVKQQPAAGRQSIPVSVRFQTCSDRECQPPTTIHLIVPVEVLPSV